jgi:hypothetical protein
MNFILTILGEYEDGAEPVAHEAREAVRELVGRGVIVTHATLRHGQESNPQVTTLPIPAPDAVTRRGRLVQEDAPPTKRGRKAREG